MGNNSNCWYFLDEAIFAFKRFQIEEITRKIALNWIDNFNEGDYGIIQNLDKNNSLYLNNGCVIRSNKIKKFRVIKKDTNIGCLVVEFLSINGKKSSFKTMEDLYKNIMHLIIDAIYEKSTIDGFPDVEDAESGPISNEAAYELLNNYLSEKLYIGLNPEYADAVLLGDSKNFDPMIKEKLIAKERKRVRDYNNSIRIYLNNSNDVKKLLNSFKKGSQFWYGGVKFVVQSVSKNGKRHITAISSNNKKPKHLTQSWFETNHWVECNIGYRVRYKAIYKSEPQKYTK